jgi:hypothetical protein
MIDRGKALGRTTWVEKNQANLIRLESITFTLVAILSGVSKSYLYTCTEVRERIESLREQQTGQMIAQRATQVRTAAGRDNLLVAKDRRI